jgi:muramoyltetrapeptide carboxypeptidase
MLIAPPFLKPGDQVAVTALASKLEIRNIEVGLEILKNWGLEVVVGETIGSSFNNYAGTEAQRQNEFQGFLDNPSIKMIIAARGGYGCSKFIDNLDFSSFLVNPKWIIGFSDITALLLKVNSLGFQAIHGVMVKTMTQNHESNNSLYKSLFGQPIEYIWPATTNNRFGIGNGEAIGGNLALIAHNIGSKSDLDFDQKILFLEDISEYYYNIDRMMVQLKRAGKLANLAGLVIGDFSDLKDNDESFGKNIEEIVLEHTKDYLFPIAFNFAFGHENLNLAIRMGEDLKLEVNENGVSLKTK